MKAFLTYALNTKGVLVHIDSVPNGNECGCRCPHCKSVLCAKNGGDERVKVHHFAHLNGADCKGAVESAIHLMAKDILKEALCIQLPDDLDGYRGDLLKFDRVEVEPYDPNTHLRPDCIGYYGDKFLWIEFKRTHAVDTIKRGKILEARIPCVELDLNSCSLDKDSLHKFITEEREQRIWIKENGQCANSAMCDNRNYLRYSYDDDNYESRKNWCILAKDENGTIVNIQKDMIDPDAHSYYCLACGEEVFIKEDKSGAYKFAHLDSDRCYNTMYYLKAAAEAIILYRFKTSKEFIVLIPQKRKCEDNTKCSFYHTSTCSSSRDLPYDLKAIGYDCFNIYRRGTYEYIKSLVIRKGGDVNHEISIRINTGSNRVDSTYCDRSIEFDIFNEYALLSLLYDSVKVRLSTNNGPQVNNEKLAPKEEFRKNLITFSLCSNGEYTIERTSCQNIVDRESDVVAEYIYASNISDEDAECYSLHRCYKQHNIKTCYCKICQYYETKHFFTLIEGFCTNRATTGSSYYNPDSKPIDCPYFREKAYYERYFEQYNESIKENDVFWGE